MCENNFIKTENACLSCLMYSTTNLPTYKKNQSFILLLRTDFKLFLDVYILLKLLRHMIFFFSHHFTLEANQSFGMPCGVPAQLGVSRDPERYLISTLCIFLACKHALFTLCLSLPFNTMSSNYPSCNQISDCCVNLPRAVRDVNTFIQMLMCYRGNKERLAHWGEGWKGDPQCLLSAARNKWQAI